MQRSVFDEGGPDAPVAVIPQVTAIVLAAGASRRMGRAKALLPWRGSPLIAHLCRAFYAAGVADVRAVVPPGTAHDAIRDALAMLPLVQIVVNPEPERGMLSSVQAALEPLSRSSTPCPDFLVCPVDYPLLEARHIAPLTVVLPAPFKIAVPTWGGRRGHPTRFAGELTRDILRLDSGVVGLNHLVRRYDLLGQVWEWPAPDDAVLRDADTPEDWSALAQARPPAGESEQ